MISDSVYELWKKVLFRNPSLSGDIRVLLEKSDLNQEERTALEAEMLDGLTAVGKHSGKYYKAAYGPGNNITTQAAAEDQERSLAESRQYENIQAYKKDVLGSYTQAEKTALEAGAVGFFTDAQKRREFINRARAVSIEEFETQRKEELDAVADKYDVNRNQVRSDILDVLDQPVSVVNALGRDIGEIAGGIQDAYSTAASGLLGEDSMLGRGTDRAAKVVTAVRDDLKRIYAESPWLVKKMREAGANRVEMKDVNAFMHNIRAIYSSWTRGFLSDMAEVLDEWYHDPRTLCCFIKNLAAIGKLTQAELFAGQVKVDLTSFFNKIIVILKVIRQYLQQDLAYSFMLGIDLSFGIAKATVGSLIAFLLALQQMIEDAVYYRMLAYIQKNISDELRQCFPFEKLLKILADFLTGPEGLLKYIEDYIDSFMTGFSSDMNYGFNLAKKIKMIDLTAIDRLISMIEMIRDGLMTFELCIEADFRETPLLNDDSTRTEKNVGFSSAYPGYPRNAGETKRQDGEKRASLKVVFPTDSEVKAFIMNRMGETAAFADQVIATGPGKLSGRASGSTDDAGAGGAVQKLTTAIGDCSRIIEHDKIVELAKMMATWDLSLT